MGRGCCHHCGFVNSTPLPSPRPSSLELFLPPLSMLGLSLLKTTPTINKQVFASPHIAKYAFGYSRLELELFDVVAWSYSSAIKSKQPGRDTVWSNMPLDLWMVGDISMGGITWHRLTRSPGSYSLWYIPVMGRSEPPSLPDEFNPAAWGLNSELTSVTLFARLMGMEWSWLEMQSAGAAPPPSPVAAVESAAATPPLSVEDDPYGLKSVNRKRDALLASIFN